MPTINTYYFHTVRVLRGKDIAGGRRSYITTGTVDVHLQRSDDANSAIDSQLFGATHKIWCDISTDIKDDDKIIDSYGNQYKVVAVRIDGVDWAINQHKEILLRYYND